MVGSMLHLVHRYSQSFIKDIHHAVPVLSFDLGVFTVCCDAAMELTDIVESFPLQPA